MPHGGVPSWTIGAREQRSGTEALNAAADHGNLYQFLLLLRWTFSAGSHVCVLVPLKLYGPPGSLQISVVVEHRAGGIGCVRDREGGWEGECRPDIEGKASSDAQGEGGKYRSFAKYEGVLVQFALGFLIWVPRTLK